MTERENLADMSPAVVNEDRSLNHKTMRVCCAKSSVDRDCVLVPEIFLTVQGRRRFLSRSSVEERW
jgi:hypothetical protein